MRAEGTGRGGVRGRVLSPGLAVGVCAPELRRSGVDGSGAGSGRGPGSRTQATAWSVAVLGASPAAGGPDAHRVPGTVHCGPGHRQQAGGSHLRPGEQDRVPESADQEI